jgi:hypothetical protein
MTNGILTAVIALVVLLAGAYLMANQASVDLAGPLRNWFWERDARRIRTRGVFPQRIERSYWNAAEFARDSARLEALGYIRVAEMRSEPYVILPDVGLHRGTPPRRRVPMFHVKYERRTAQPR